MAKGPKTGLDYFPFDVDFFGQAAIEFVSANFGIKGEAIAVRLMCRIYKNGYSAEFNSDIAKLFARSVGDVSLHGLVNDVVHELLRRGFFHQDIFKSFGILTSIEIQETYKRICTDAKRKGWKIDEKFNLLPLNTGIIPENSGVTPESHGKNSGKNGQSIVKESKEEETNTVSTQDEPAAVEEIREPVVVPEQPPAPEPLKERPEESKKKVALKKKDEKPGREHWQKFVDTFYNFYKAKFPEPYQPKKKEWTEFGDIYDRLRKKSESKFQEWDESEVAASFSDFLESAYKVKWLSDHFTVPNLSTQYNIIVNGTAIQQPAILTGQSKSAVQGQRATSIIEGIRAKHSGQPR